ncbi:TMV resistance protein N [Glycine soja]
MRYETKFIEEIVEKVYKKIPPKALYTNQNPVELGARIKEKTLLLEMQEELETELGGSKSKRMYEIKRKLRRKKVPLVLDDVDDKDKLEKLAGGCDCFGSGSDLATLDEESLDDWECALEEYERTPPERIQDVLKKSYDRLGDNVKQEFGSTSNINVLVNKSLLTIEYGCLKMHDLIQDMGREIVRKEAPKNPGQLSRLWYYVDVIEILTDDLGSDKIEGIMLDPPQRAVVDWSGFAFEKMEWLRILIVRNTSFSYEPKHLPNHLRVLDWEEYDGNKFKLAYTPCKHIFYQNLEKFRELSPAIATWIDRISKEKWTMTYDREGRRYGHMTTNLSECINKVLKDCRTIPITALVKSTYSRCRKYFVECGRQAQRQLNEGQVYCSKLVKELRKNQEQACLHIVRVYDIHSTRFEVEETFNPITQRGGQK